MSNYWKKKMDELNNETKKPTSQSYWETKVAELEDEKKQHDKIVIDLSKITTVKSDKKDDEGLLDFFQKSSVFEDGYDFGDITKTILGTVGDVGLNALKGAAGMGEGLVDLAGHGVANTIGLASRITGDKGSARYAEDLHDKFSENYIDNKLKPAEDYLDKYSVFGRTSDAIAQGIGQVGTILLTGGLAAGAGLSATAATVGMGLSGMGSGMSHAYQEGATDGEAALYGAISGASDALSELMFGGLGKAVKATGLSHGAFGLDDMLAKKISNLFSSQLMKNSAELGIKATGEGLEEVFAGTAQAIGENLTYMDEEELGELLKDENLLEQFVVGALTSGITQAPSVHQEIKSGRDFVTGLNQDEQAVINKEIENRIAEQEQDGKKLTKQEKAVIEAQVERDFERGYISTDLIDEIVGGETYAEYKKSVEEEDALFAEFEELGKTQNATLEQQYRYGELRDRVQTIKDTDARSYRKAELDRQVAERVNGTRLAESYNEKARRGQAFAADVTQYDEKQRATYQKAIDSGVLNNTNRSHELVETVAKISADKGIVFDFTNTAKMREMGMVEEGVVKNGFITKDGITINVDSAKAWQSITGHEVTHALEQSDHYAELQEAVFEYAKTKGEYDSRLDAITKLYAKYAPDADLTKELTADLVGDYIFTDENFVNNLAVDNRNLFKKIWDEVKYLWKTVTAGSKEARQLEKVKRAFEKAYKESGKIDNGTQYSMSVEDKETLDFLNEQVSRGEYNEETNPNGGYYVTYKSMSYWGEDENGNAILRAPMAEYVDGKLSPAYLLPKDKSKLNWYRATETIDEATGLPSGMMVRVKKPGNKSYTYLPAAENQDLIADDWSNLFFKLTKKTFENGKWKTSDVPARYNPYEHSSDLMLNDQFSAAYKRDNLVTVKMYVPVSEDNGAFRAKYSKDATGWNEWKAGTVAGKLAKEKGLNRRVYLSRYSAPVEIVPDSEVAQAYKEYVEGTSVAIPDNVVPPNLLNELRKAGVPIAESGKVKYSLSADSDGRRLSDEQREYFKDSKVVDENGNLKVMYHGTSGGGHTVFDPYGKARYGLFGAGSYFTDNKDVAESYTNKGKGKSPQVYETYLNITNPMDMDAAADAEAWAKAMPDVRFPEVGTNEAFYRAMEEYFEDAEYARWEAAETAMEVIEGMGYDGITHIGGGRFNKADATRHRVYIAFQPEQIKNVDNAKPTENPDIRYSLSTDNEGKQLTEKQAEYFKDSKMRDADGNLMVMYHGTQNGGFHTFDRRYSDDHTSFFFTDSNDVAMSYSSTSETYEAKTIRTAEDMNAFLAEIGYDSYEAVEKDGKFALMEDGDEVATSDTPQGIYEEFCWYEGVGDGNVNYKVYLNIKNPLEVDAEGREWGEVLIPEEHRAKFNKIIFGINHPNARVDTATTRNFSEYANAQDYDGVIFKNIRDNGEYGGNDISTVAIAFDSNQIKSVANTSPTADADIRYSLSVDSKGRELPPAVKKRFANSKVVDEDGNLKAVYHGTYAGEFSIFDKSKGSVDGDFGSGFYFTDNEGDVETNYEGGGPDYENKVARRAEQIEQEEDIDYDEAEERAREELYKGGHKFEVYLNIENPAIVGKTILLDGESIREQYDEDDFDDYDEYNEEVEQAVYEEIENIVWEVEKNVDVYSTDGLFDVLFEAYSYGGVDIETLKTNVAELYLEDSEGNYVNNEVVRQIIESLGYDGIIDQTVSSKFSNMGMEDGTTHYIVFKPNQIKAVTNQTPTDNPDIHLSMSADGKQRPTGSWYTPANETALEVAPVAVAENATTTEDSSAAPIAENTTPVVENATTVRENTTPVEELFPDDNVPMSEEYEADRMDSLFYEEAPPEMDAPYYEDYYEGKPAEVKDPFEDRDFYEIGKQRSVKAYQYENPEVKPFFQEMAKVMLQDIKDGIKGEKWYNSEVAYEQGNEAGWGGTKRQIASDIAELLDYGYTYAQIEKGLHDIIEDDGKENNACAKRIEFVLNDRLLYGYTDMWEQQMPANPDYIKLLEEKEITEYSKEAFAALDDRYAPPVAEDIAPVAAPVQQKQETAAEMQQKPRYVSTASEQMKLPLYPDPNNVSPAMGEVQADGEIAPVFETESGQQALMPEEEKPAKIRRKELHENIINRVKDVFHVRGFDFDEVLKNAKDLSTFSTVDNIPQRVMEKALGYKEGKILSDLTVNQVAQNETKGIQWLNSYTDRKTGVLAQISKQYNIKPGSKKSAAAQMYAEGFYVTDNGDIVEYGDRELAKDFPDAREQAQIKGLARDPRIRQIYDDTLAAINESRVRNAYPEIPRLDNYFLHFRAMNDTFSKLGLPFNPNDIRAKDLPTDLNGVTADLKPGQPFFASAMHRTGKRTSFDLLGGLEQYLNSAKNQIYHIDDIQNLRALRNYIADTYGQANGLEGLDALSEEEQQDRIEQVYNSHLSTFAKFLNEEANILAGKTALIDRGLEGIIGRRGMTFFDTLNRQVGSNMVGYNVSSSLTNFVSLAQGIAKSNKAAFIKGLAQFAANKVNSIRGNSDGFAEQSPVMVRRKGIEKFHRTAWQKISDPGYILMSAVDSVSTELIARAKYNELTANGMDSQQAHIETDKWVSRLMGDRSLGQQPQLYNSKMLGMITKFQLEVRNQLDSQFYDTIQDAKLSTEQIENKLIRNAMTASKVTSTLVQLSVAQHLFGQAFESVAGYNPAFDIISAIIKTFGWDDDEDDEDTVLDNIEEGFFELMGDMPYVSTLTGGRIPIASALPISELYKGEDQYGNEKSRWETLSEAAPYYFLPAGYSQIKKTVQGLNMFSDEHPVAGSYTDSGNLRFPVEDSTANRMQAAVFGQWASENAREYFNDDRLPLKEKQTQEFADSGMTIQEYWSYRDGLKDLDKQADKVRYINGLDLTAAQKIVLKSYLFDEEGYKEENPEKYAFLEKEGIGYIGWKELDEETKESWSWAFTHQDEYRYFKENGVYPEDYSIYRIPMLEFDDEKDEAYQWAFDNPENATLGRVFSGGVKEYRTYAIDLSAIRADKDKNGKSISGSAKAKKIDYINSLDIDYGEKLILYKSQYDSKADRNKYNQEILDYLNSRNDISYEEKVTILRELKFTVDEEGNVDW